MTTRGWESGGRLGVTNVDRHGWTVIVQSNREQVALVRHKHDVPLVLAAPDLYEALEMFWRAIGQRVTWGPYDDDIRDAMTAANRALARARGEE